MRILSSLELRFFQLRVLLHQLFDTVTRELNADFSILTFAFALEHRSLAVFRMAHPHAWLEADATAGRLNVHLRTGELLAARGEELGDVVDRVVALAGVG